LSDLQLGFIQKLPAKLSQFLTALIQAQSLFQGQLTILHVSTMVSSSAKACS